MCLILEGETKKRRGGESLLSQANEEKWVLDLHRI